MTATRKPQNTWILVACGALAFLLVGITLTLDTLYAPIDGFVRAGALLGYLCVFLTALSSNFMKELSGFFGRPFIKVHHLVAVPGLLALALHTVAAAWRAGSALVFRPRFDSAYTFFSLGGRPAFWFIAIASLTALLRAAIGKQWKLIHWLNYLAFFLGTAHAWLIGPNFQHPGVKAGAALLALVLLGVFIRKRLPRRRKR